MKRRSALTRKGILLLEMLFVIALLSVAMLIEVRLFRATIHVVSDVPEIQNQQSALDQIVATMRRDVWSANQIEMTGSSKVVLSRPDGPGITWTFSSGGTDGQLVVREVNSNGAADLRRWTIAQPLEAERDGPALILRASDTKVYPPQEQRLISQLLFARQKGMR